MKTKTPEHTPIPWKVSHELGDGISIARQIGQGNGLLPIALATFTRNYNTENAEVAKANAAFIVRAVNSHDALMKALKTLVVAINTKTPDSLIVFASIEKARAALAAAEREG